MENQPIPKFYLWHKLTAIFVSTCFMLCNLFGNTPSIYAAQPELKSPIQISQELGTVEEFHRGDSPKTIIYIQDAHDSLEAQVHIAGLIKDLVRDYGIKTVYEEGYEGKLPTDKFFDFIKNPKIKEKVSYFLLDMLRLGGPEYAHINRTQDFKLIGVERIKLYKENLKWYQKAAQKRKIVEEDLNELLKQITKLGHQYLPKDLKTWLKFKEKFIAQQLPLLDYLKELQILSVKSIPANEFVLRYPLAGLVLNAYRLRNPGLEKKLKAIDSKALFEEIDRIESNFSKGLLTSDRDRQIFQSYQDIILLKRLNQIELTQAEYEAAKEILARIKTEKILKFVVEQTKRPLVLFKEWERSIRAAAKFYEAAKERDESIEPHMKDFMASDETTSILVFGGFHSGKIKEMLNQNGLSYLVVSPKITAVDQRHKDYYKHLMGGGRHAFEIPFYLSRATRVESSFYFSESALKSELRAIADVAQRLPNLKFDELISSRLIAEGLASLSLSRSESRNDFSKDFDFKKLTVRQELAQKYLARLGVQWDLIRPSSIPAVAPLISEIEPGNEPEEVFLTRMIPKVQELARRLKGDIAIHIMPSANLPRLVTQSFNGTAYIVSGPILRQMHVDQDLEQAKKFLEDFMEILYTTLGFGVRTKEGLPSVPVALFIKPSQAVGQDFTRRQESLYRDVVFLRYEYEKGFEKSLFGLIQWRFEEIDGQHLELLRQKIAEIYIDKILEIAAEQKSFRRAEARAKKDKPSQRMEKEELLDLLTQPPSIEIIAQLITDTGLTYKELKLHNSLMVSVRRGYHQVSPQQAAQFLRILTPFFVPLLTVEELRRLIQHGAGVEPFRKYDAAEFRFQINELRGQSDWQGILDLLTAQFQIPGKQINRANLTTLFIQKKPVTDSQAELAAAALKEAVETEGRLEWSYVWRALLEASGIRLTAETEAPKPILVDDGNMLEQLKHLAAQGEGGRLLKELFLLIPGSRGQVKLLDNSLDHLKKMNRESPYNPQIEGWLRGLVRDLESALSQQSASKIPTGEIEPLLFRAFRFQIDPAARAEARTPTILELESQIPEVLAAHLNSDSSEAFVLNVTVTRFLSGLQAYVDQVDRESDSLPEWAKQDPTRFERLIRNVRDISSYGDERRYPFVEEAVLNVIHEMKPEQEIPLFISSRPSPSETLGSDKTTQRKQPRKSPSQAIRYGGFEGQVITVTDTNLATLLPYIRQNLEIPEHLQWLTPREGRGHGDISIATLYEGQSKKLLTYVASSHFAGQLIEPFIQKTGEREYSIGLQVKSQFTGEKFVISSFIFARNGKIVRESTAGALEASNKVSPSEVPGPEFVIIKEIVYWLSQGSMPEKLRRLTQQDLKAAGMGGLFNDRNVAFWRVDVFLNILSAYSNPILTFDPAPWLLPAGSDAPPPWVATIWTRKEDDRPEIPTASIVLFSEEEITTPEGDIIKSGYVRDRPVVPGRDRKGSFLAGRRGYENVIGEIARGERSFRDVFKVLWNIYWLAGGTDAVPENDVVFLKNGLDEYLFSFRGSTVMIPLGADFSKGETVRSWVSLPHVAPDARGIRYQNFKDGNFVTERYFVLFQNSRFQEHQEVQAPVSESAVVNVSTMPQQPAVFSRADALRVFHERLTVEERFLLVKERQRLLRGMAELDQETENTRSLQPSEQRIALERIAADYRGLMDDAETLSSIEKSGVIPPDPSWQHRLHFSRSEYASVEIANDVQSQTRFSELVHQAIEGIAAETDWQELVSQFGMSQTQTGAKIFRGIKLPVKKKKTTTSETISLIYPSRMGDPKISLGSYPKDEVILTIQREKKGHDGKDYLRIRLYDPERLNEPLNSFYFDPHAAMNGSYVDSKEEWKNYFFGESELGVPGDMAASAITDSGRVSVFRSIRPEQGSRTIYGAIDLGTAFYEVLDHRGFHPFGATGSGRHFYFWVREEKNQKFVDVYGSAETISSNLIAVFRWMADDAEWQQKTKGETGFKKYGRDEADEMMGYNTDHSRSHLLEDWLGSKMSGYLELVTPGQVGSRGKVSYPTPAGLEKSQSSIPIAGADLGTQVFWRTVTETNNKDSARALDVYGPAGEFEGRVYYSDERPNGVNAFIDVIRRFNRLVTSLKEDSETEIPEPVLYSRTSSKMAPDLELLDVKRVSSGKSRGSNVFLNAAKDIEAMGLQGFDWTHMWVEFGLAEENNTRFPAMYFIPVDLKGRRAVFVLRVVALGGSEFRYDSYGSGHDLTERIFQNISEHGYSRVLKDVVYPAIIQRKIKLIENKIKNLEDPSRAASQTLYPVLNNLFAGILEPETNTLTIRDLFYPSVTNQKTVEVTYFFVPSSGLKEPRTRTVDLKEGVNSISLEERDPITNTLVSKEIEIILTTKPPVFTQILAPKTTRSSELFISYKFRDEIDNEEKSGRRKVQLAEGRNEVILKITDRAGNTTSELVFITLDSTPPEIINIDAPEITNQTHIIITYTARDNIDGDSEGVQEVDLVEGINVVTLEVSDQAGNVNQIQIQIVRDIVPPEIVEVQAPEFTSQEKISITYTVRDAVDGDTTAAQEVSLEMGENRIVLEAQDRAGNKTKQELVITREPVALQNAVSYEFWPEDFRLLDRRLFITIPNTASYQDRLKLLENLSGDYAALLDANPNLRASLNLPEPDLGAEWDRFRANHKKEIRPTPALLYRPIEYDWEQYRSPSLEGKKFYEKLREQILAIQQEHPEIEFFWIEMAPAFYEGGTEHVLHPAFYVVGLNPQTGTATNVHRVLEKEKNKFIKREGRSFEAEPFKDPVFAAALSQGYKFAGHESAFSDVVETRLDLARRLIDVENQPWDDAEASEHFLTQGFLAALEEVRHAHGPSYLAKLEKTYISARFATAGLSVLEIPFLIRSGNLTEIFHLAKEITEKTELPTVEESLALLKAIIGNKQILDIFGYQHFRLDPFSILVHSSEEGRQQDLLVQTAQKLARDLESVRQKFDAPFVLPSLPKQPQEAVLSEAVIPESPEPVVSGPEPTQIEEVPVEAEAEPVQEAVSPEAAEHQRREEEIRLAGENPMTGIELAREQFQSIQAEAAEGDPRLGHVADLLTASSDIESITPTDFKEAAARVRYFLLSSEVAERLETDLEMVLNFVKQAHAAFNEFPFEENDELRKEVENRILQVVRLLEPQLISAASVEEEQEIGNQILSLDPENRTVKKIQAAREILQKIERLVETLKRGGQISLEDFEGREGHIEDLRRSVHGFRRLYAERFLDERLEAAFNDLERAFNKRQASLIQTTLSRPSFSPQRPKSRFRRETPKKPEAGAERESQAPVFQITIKNQADLDKEIAAAVQILNDWKERQHKGKTAHLTGTAERFLLELVSEGRNLYRLHQLAIEFKTTYLELAGKQSFQPTGKLQDLLRKLTPLISQVESKIVLTSRAETRANQSINLPDAMIGKLPQPLQAAVGTYRRVIELDRATSDDPAHDPTVPLQKKILEAVRLIRQAPKNLEPKEIKQLTDRITEIVNQAIAVIPKDGREKSREKTLLAFRDYAAEFVSFLMNVYHGPSTSDVEVARKETKVEADTYELAPVEPEKISAGAPQVLVTTSSIAEDIYFPEAIPSLAQKIMRAIGFAEQVSQIRHRFWFKAAALGLTGIFVTVAYRYYMNFIFDGHPERAESMLVAVARGAFWILTPLLIATAYWMIKLNLDSHSGLPGGSRKGREPSQIERLPDDVLKQSGEDETSRSEARATQVDQAIDAIIEWFRADDDHDSLISAINEREIKAMGFKTKWFHQNFPAIVAGLKEKILEDNFDPDLAATIEEAIKIYERVQESYLAASSGKKASFENETEEEDALALPFSPRENDEQPVVIRPRRAAAKRTIQKSAAPQPSPAGGNSYLLRNPNASSEQALILALEAMNPNEIEREVPAIIDLIEHRTTNPNLILAGMTAFQKAGKSSAADAIVRVGLRSTEYKLRESAINLLALSPQTTKEGQWMHFSEIALRLEDSHPGVAVAAINALYQLGTDEEIKNLEAVFIKLAQMNADEKVRLAANQVLIGRLKQAPLAQKTDAKPVPASSRPPPSDFEAPRGWHFLERETRSTASRFEPIHPGLLPDDPQPLNVEEPLLKYNSGPKSTPDSEVSIVVVFSGSAPPKRSKQLKLQNLTVKPIEYIHIGQIKEWLKSEGIDVLSIPPAMRRDPKIEEMIQSYLQKHPGTTIISASPFHMSAGILERVKGNKVKMAPVRILLVAKQDEAQDPKKIKGPSSKMLRLLDQKVEAVNQKTGSYLYLSGVDYVIGLDELENRLRQNDAGTFDILIAPSVFLNDPTFNRLKDRLKQLNPGFVGYFDDPATLPVELITTWANERFRAEARTAELKNWRERFETTLEQLNGNALMVHIPQDGMNRDRKYRIRQDQFGAVVVDKFTSDGWTSWIPLGQPLYSDGFVRVDRDGGKNNLFEVHRSGETVFIERSLEASQGVSPFYISFESTPRTEARALASVNMQEDRLEFLLPDEWDALTLAAQNYVQEFKHAPFVPRNYWVSEASTTPDKFAAHRYLLLGMAQTLGKSAGDLSSSDFKKPIYVFNGKTLSGMLQLKRNKNDSYQDSVRALKSKFSIQDTLKSYPKSAQKTKLGSWIERSTDWRGVKSIFRSFGWDETEKLPQSAMLFFIRLKDASSEISQDDFNQFNLALHRFVQEGNGPARLTMSILNRRLIFHSVKNAGENRDLEQELQLGLLRAIETWDPLKKPSFGAYAKTVLNRRASAWYQAQRRQRLSRSNRTGSIERSKETRTPTTPLLVTPANRAYLAQLLQPFFDHVLNSGKVMKDVFPTHFNLYLDYLLGEKPSVSGERYQMSKAARSIALIRIKKHFAPFQQQIADRVNDLIVGQFSRPAAVGRSEARLSEILDAEIRDNFVRPLNLDADSLQSWRIEFVGRERLIIGAPQPDLSPENAENLMFEQGRKAVQILKENLFTVGETVLDVGSGPKGGFAFISALLGADVTSFEKDPEAVIALKAKFEKLEPFIRAAGGNWQVIEGDFSKKEDRQRLKTKFQHVIATDVILPEVNPNHIIAKSRPATAPEEIAGIIDGLGEVKNEEPGMVLLSIPTPVTSIERMYFKKIFESIGRKTGLRDSFRHSVSTPFSMGVKQGLLTIWLVNLSSEPPHTGYSRPEAREEQPLSDETLQHVAGQIYAAFKNYYEDKDFSRITRRAKKLFEKRQWVEVVSDAQELMRAYPQALDQIERQVSELLGKKKTDEIVWQKLKELYPLNGLYNDDLATTFFYSVKRRLFGKQGIPVEYDEEGVSFKETTETKNLYRIYSKEERSYAALITKMMEDANFEAPFEDLERDSKLAAELLSRELREHYGFFRYYLKSIFSKLFDVLQFIILAWPAQWRVHAPFESAEILKTVFFRNKGAYAIGRIRSGNEVIPLALPLLNEDDSGGITIDAVLLGENQVTSIFSYALANFRVETEGIYRELAKFLDDLLPRRSLADVLSSIGYLHPAKIEFIKDIRRTLAKTGEKFKKSEGIDGHIMLDFTLPSFPYVFKFMKDDPIKPDFRGRAHLEERFRMVHEYDRGGRVLDSIALSHLRLKKSFFQEALLNKLLREAPSNIREEGDEVIFNKIYAQRKIRPYKEYIEDAQVSEDDKIRATIDRGYAIKETAAAGLFPGDFYGKNWGVGHGGRIYYFDIDEIQPLDEMRFVSYPQSNYGSDDLSPVEDTVWYGDDYFFPEELKMFIFGSGPYNDIFLRHHSDLLTIEYWKDVQNQRRSGKLPDIIPYDRSKRLHHYMSRAEARSLEVIAKPEFHIRNGASPVLLELSLGRLDEIVEMYLSSASYEHVLKNQPQPVLRYRVHFRRTELPAEPEPAGEIELKFGEEGLLESVESERLAVPAGFEESGELLKAWLKGQVGSALTSDNQNLFPIQKPPVVAVKKVVKPAAPRAPPPPQTIVPQPSETASTNHATPQTTGQIARRLLTRLNRAKNNGEFPDLSALNSWMNSELQNAEITRKELAQAAHKKGSAAAQFMAAVEALENSFSPPSEPAVEIPGRTRPSRREKASKSADPKEEKQKASRAIDRLMANLSEAIANYEQHGDGLHAVLKFLEQANQKAKRSHKTFPPHHAPALNAANGKYGMYLRDGSASPQSKRAEARETRERTVETIWGEDLLIEGDYVHIDWPAVWGIFQPGGPVQKMMRRLKELKGEALDLSRVYLQKIEDDNAPDEPLFDAAINDDRHFVFEMNSKAFTNYRAYGTEVSIAHLISREILIQTDSRFKRFMGSGNPAQYTFSDATESLRYSDLLYYINFGLMTRLLIQSGSLHSAMLFAQSQAEDLTELISKTMFSENVSSELGRFLITANLYFLINPFKGGIRYQRLMNEINESFEIPGFMEDFAQRYSGLLSALEPIFNFKAPPTLEQIQRHYLKVIDQAFSEPEAEEVIVELVGHDRFLIYGFSEIPQVIHLPDSIHNIRLSDYFVEELQKLNQQYWHFSKEEFNPEPIGAETIKFSINGGFVFGRLDRLSDFRTGLERALRIAKGIRLASRNRSEARAAGDYDPDTAEEEYSADRFSPQAGEDYYRDHIRTWLRIAQDYYESPLYSYSPFVDLNGKRIYFDWAMLQEWKKLPWNDFKTEFLQVIYGALTWEAEGSIYRLKPHGQAKPWVLYLTEKTPTLKVFQVEYLPSRRSEARNYYRIEIQNEVMRSILQPVLDQLYFPSESSDQTAAKQSLYDLFGEKLKQIASAKRLTAEPHLQSLYQQMKTKGTTDQEIDDELIRIASGIQQSHQTIPSDVAQFFATFTQIDPERHKRLISQGIDFDALFKTTETAIETQLANIISQNNPLAQTRVRLAEQNLTERSVAKELLLEFFSERFKTDPDGYEITLDEILEAHVFKEVNSIVLINILSEMIRSIDEERVNIFELSRNRYRILPWVDNQNFKFGEPVTVTFSMLHMIKNAAKAVGIRHSPLQPVFDHVESFHQLIDSDIIADAYLDNIVVASLDFVRHGLWEIFDLYHQNKEQFLAKVTSTITKKNDQYVLTIVGTGWSEDGIEKSPRPAEIKSKNAASSFKEAIDAFGWEFKTKTDLRKKKVEFRMTIPARAEARAGGDYNFKSEITGGDVFGVGNNALQNKWLAQLRKLLKDRIKRLQMPFYFSSFAGKMIHALKKSIPTRTSEINRIFPEWVAKRPDPTTTTLERSIKDFATSSSFGFASKFILFLLLKATKTNTHLIINQVKNDESIYIISRAEARSQLPGTSAVYERFEQFVLAHLLSNRQNSDGTLYVPTPPNVLPAIFKYFESKIGSLEGKRFISFGAGTLSDSLAAASLYQMNVTAIEKDPELSGRAVQILQEAEDEGLIQKGAVDLRTDTDAFDVSWKDADIVYFFYTQAGGDDKTRNTFRQNFENNLKTKISEMKPGAHLAFLFTGTQRLAGQHEYSALEEIPHEVINISDQMTGLYLVLYEIPARAEVRDGLNLNKGTQLSFDESVELLKQTVVHENATFTSPLDLMRTITLAREIFKHPIQKIVVVGAGSMLLPLLLASTGKEVIFVDKEIGPIKKMEEDWKKLQRKLEQQGLKLNSKLLGTSLGEIGTLDLKSKGILPHSFDLVTFIDLIGGAPQGDPKNWLFKAKELLKNQTGYVVVDEDTALRPKNTIKYHFSSVFPKHELLANDYFAGSYNQETPANRFYKVEVEEYPRRAEARKIMQPAAVDIDTEPKLSSKRASEVTRSIRTDERPVNIFMNAEDFTKLSQDQKNEYLYAAIARKNLQIVIYNDHGQVKDKELMALRDLRNGRVIVSKESFEVVLARYEKGKVPNLHFSKTASVNPHAFKGRAFFFRQDGECAGMLAAALLWAVTDVKSAAFLGITPSADGFMTVTSGILALLQESYNADVAFAWAA